MGGGCISLGMYIVKGVGIYNFSQKEGVTNHIIGQTP